MHADSGKFWRWAVLRVNPRVPAYQSNLISSRRIALVPEIWIFPNTLLSQLQITLLFSMIKDTPDLKLTELYLCGQDISKVPPEDFATAISRLESFKIMFGTLSTGQATTILTMAKQNRLGRLNSLQIVCSCVLVSRALLEEAKLNHILDWI